ncbi:MAG: hypothetical protein ACRBBN_21830 [Methyloligellaceae bacterium]
MNDIDSVELDGIMTVAAADAILGVYENPHDTDTDTLRSDIYRETYKARRLALSRTRARL